jgi:Ca2+:H+ antiporter
LLPEGFAAIRAARKNRLQTSLNLALGSAVATVSFFGGFPVTLGIDAKSMVLLMLLMFTIILSFGNGRTTIL